MSTENVTYKITGEDRASSVFTKVRGAIEANDKSVTQWAKAVKDGSQITGQWGQALSGLPLGPVGQQVSQMADQFEKLFQAKKQGATGSAIFKAGMIGMVTAVSFKVGQVIGDWINDTKGWREQLEAAMAQANSTADMLISKAQRRHAWQLKMNEALAEPADREKAHVEYMAEIERQIQEQQKSVNKANAEHKELLNTWANTLGYADDAKKVSQATIDIETKRLKALQAQRDEIKDIVGQKAKDLAQAQAIRAETEKAASIEKQLRLEILALTDPQEAERQKATEGILNEERRKSIELLLEQKNAIEEKQKAEAKAAADALKAEQELQKQREKSEQDRIKRLQEQERERQKFLDSLNKIKFGSIGTSAVESRLMTRGSGVDNEKQIADNTRKMVETQLKLQMQQQQATKYLQQIANNPAIVFGAA